MLSQNSGTKYIAPLGVHTKLRLIFALWVVLVKNFRDFHRSRHRSLRALPVLPPKRYIESPQITASLIHCKSARGVDAGNRPKKSADVSEVSIGFFVMKTQKWKGFVKLCIVSAISNWKIAVETTKRSSESSGCSIIWVLWCLVI